MRTTKQVRITPLVFAKSKVMTIQKKTEEEEVEEKEETQEAEEAKTKAAGTPEAAGCREGTLGLLSLSSQAQARPSSKKARPLILCF